MDKSLFRYFLLPAALSALPLHADDWPQWGGRNARNFVAHETGLPASFRPDRTDVTNSVTTLVPDENVKWTAPLGTQAYVTPAVAQGRVYIGANDANVDTDRFARTKGSVLDCLDEATGKRLWRLVMPRLKTKNKQFNFKDGKKLPYNKGGIGPSEIIATPVIVSNRIYVAVGQDSRHGKGKGCLSCIDATLAGTVTESGKVWQNMDVDRSFSSAAVTDDGLVFIADYTGILRCLDAGTGTEYWKHDLEGRVFCSPLCADGKVYIGTEAGRLTVAEAKREKRVLSEIRFDGPIYATPVAANGVLYIASQRTLYAFQQSQPNR